MKIAFVEYVIRKNPLNISFTHVNSHQAYGQKYIGIALGEFSAWRFCEDIRKTSSDRFIR